MPLLILAPVPPSQGSLVRGAAVLRDYWLWVPLRWAAELLLETSGLISHDGKAKSKDLESRGRVNECA